MPHNQTDILHLMKSLEKKGTKTSNSTFAQFGSVQMLGVLGQGKVYQKFLILSG